MVQQQMQQSMSVMDEVDAADDPRQAYLRLQREIRALQENGRAVPEDLKRLERHLSDECRAMSQGR